ncbi:MAG: protease complex subunit PrcB family protein [Clostridia bacterium]|nr:protease complex subunit PrcB family protein [Clostridia bacterium]
MKRFLITAIALLMAFCFAACTSPRIPEDNNQFRKNTGGPAAPSPTPAGEKTGDLNKSTGDPFKRVDGLSSFIPEKKEAIECLRWETFVSGGRSDLPSVNYETFTDYSSFAEKYGERLGSAAENYKPFGGESVFIVAVTCTVNTGGWTFGLNKAYVRDGVVYIDVSKEAPGPNMMVTQAFQNHTTLIAFESSLYKEGMPVELTINGQRGEASIGDKS